jgi:bacterioferritin
MSRSAPNAAVIEVLNEVLTAELTAINQYFLHAKMCQSWGYARLAGYLRKESIDEMKHADAVIERILYLGGLPNLQRLWHLRIGETVPEQLASDLALENEAIPRLQKGVEALRAAGDVGSALLLEGILKAEEEHKDWLEMQQDLIEQIGLQNYLAQQMHAG